MLRWAIPAALLLAGAGVLIGRPSTAGQRAHTAQLPREERGPAPASPAPPLLFEDARAAIRRETDIDRLLAATESLFDRADEVKDELLALAADDRPERRVAALSALMHLTRVDAAAIEVVLRAARADAVEDVRIAAIAALSSWMHRLPEHTDGLAHALVGLARTETHDEVRGHAIQGVALLDRRVDAVVAPMAELARADRCAQNRALAAMALGGGGAAAVPHLEAAIAVEPAAENRRAMLMQLVRAGGAEALPRIAAGRPDLAADVRDYLEILRTETDPARVWELKQHRDAERGRAAGADDHDD